ncbi:MAG: hypothetical protein V4819_21200 [Verrucomicrobiota bacterium]
MKSIIQQSIAVAAVFFTVAGSIPELQAADMRLNGSGYYKLGNREVFSTEGKEQSGRYKNLGRDYYHKVEYGIEVITNDSYSGSGTLSYEFWAMPYYGATSGIVLMTRKLGAFSRREVQEDVWKNGYAISLNRNRIPEQSLWEFTRNGWKFRDALTFTRKAYL